jgi:sodium/hydrogen exchanger 10/11
MWLHIDPHLLLYSFLPALIFADAVNLNIHLAKRVFFQCMLLAGPGVVLGSLLNALVGHYVFPYGWDWNLSMAFGAILSATDPVAVVALLKSLGASKQVRDSHITCIVVTLPLLPLLSSHSSPPTQLTMAVTGESLMNDGAAIVVFILFWDIYQGEVYTPWSGMQFFAQLALGGPLVGVLFGIVTIWMISAGKRDMLFFTS